MSAGDYSAVAERMSSRLDDIVDSTVERLWANPALEEWTRPETRGDAAAIARASIARELAALEGGNFRPRVRTRTSRRRGRRSPSVPP